METLIYEEKGDLSSHLRSVPRRIHVLPFMFEDLRRGERQVFVTYVTVVNSRQAGRS